MVVVGGGVAGVSCAARLVRSGVDVALLEAEDRLGAGWSGRGDGQVHLGLHDHPHRLVASLGQEATAEVVAWSRWNRQLVASGPFQAVGGVWTATEPREAADLERDCEAWRALGVPVAWWSEARVEEAVGGVGFTAGVHLPEEGRLDPVRWLEARAAGVAAYVGCEVVRADDDGVVLATGRRLRAELVVLAAGWRAAALDPFLREAMHPVRGQATLVPGGGAGDGSAWRAQHGHLHGGTVPGGFLLGGARWATPHREAGETSPVPGRHVADRLSALLQRHFPGVGGGAPRAWAGVMGFTCDGLPLVGPLPGKRRLACCGFNGADWSLGAAAGDAVAAMVVEEAAAEPLPRLFHPGRLI